MHPTKRKSSLSVLTFANKEGVYSVDAARGIVYVDAYARTESARSAVHTGCVREGTPN
jgi:hypothetical protein